jgi:hypothetical protein
MGPPLAMAEESETQEPCECDACNPAALRVRRPMRPAAFRPGGGSLAECAAAPAQAAQRDDLLFLFLDSDIAHVTKVPSGQDQCPGSQPKGGSQSLGIILRQFDWALLNSSIPSSHLWQEHAEAIP